MAGPPAPPRPSKSPYEALERAERKLARRNDKALRESVKRLRHAMAAEALFKARQPTPEGSPSRDNYPDRKLKKVAPRAYRKSLKVARGPHRSSGGLGEPEDLTIAITTLAPGGGFVGALGKRAVEVGGKKVVQEVGEAAARRVEASAAKGTAKALNAGSGVRAAARVASRGARRVAGRDTAKVAEKAASAAAKRSARRAAAKAATAESRAASAAVPGLKLGKVSAGQALPVVRGHEQALIENPKKTLKTTARAIPGLVTAPVGAAIDVGATGGRAASSAAHELGIPGARGYSGSEILAPIKGLAKEQLDFAKQVAQVVTASDSKKVQREVEDNLGLMLPIMLGLGAKAGGEKITKGRVTQAVRTIAERARRGKLGDFRGKTPRVFERQGQRKGEAVRSANARLRIRRETAERTKAIREHASKVPGEEVVRRGVVKRRRGKTADLKIRGGDVVGFVVRNAIDLENPRKGIAQVQRIGSRLKKPPEGVSLPADKLSTRDVVTFLERNPHVLESPRLRAEVDAYKRQAAYARKTPGLSPEHSERARFSSVAVHEDIPLPEERFPTGTEGIVRATPTRGRLAKDVLRREAHSDRRRAKLLKRKAEAATKKAAVMRRELEVREKLNKTHLDQPLADWQVRELKAVKELERRGQIPKGMAPVGGHLRVITPRRGKVSGKTLPAMHERLRERIDKLDAKAVDLRERAALAEQMARQKRKASQGFDPSLEEQFVRHAESTLARQGRPMPEYVHTGRAREAPTFGATGAKLTQFPGASKFRKGSAEEYGLVEEGLGPTLRESIARPVSRRESYAAMRGFLNDNEFRVGGKKEWTSNEARELFEEGVLDRNNYVLVPRQLYKRAYGKFDPEQAAATLKASLDGKLEGGAPGRHFKLVRRAAAQEFFDQMANTLVSPKLARFNQATSYLILGTSPAWAAMQVVAEYAQASIAQPKMLSPHFVRRALRAYKQMAPEKRQAFDSWVGVTTRTIDRAEDLKLDLKAGDMEAAANAYGVMNATPYGKFIKGIPTAISRVDQWKGGRIRALATIAKADKELNGKLNRFIGGIGGLDREMGKALKELRGKPLSKQLEFVAEHPKWAQRYQSYLDDVMGNWSALTKNERVAAQLAIFYPFIRMSLRWTFYAFPKRHPIKAAMAYYLGQQNANQLEKFYKGDPSYFTKWATVLVPTGDGRKVPVDLSRIAPGSNALIEAAGGNAEGPKGIVAARSAQPVLAALGTAIYGVTPLSGKQEKNSGLNALAQILPTNLSAPGRVLNEKLIPSGRKPAEGAGQTVSPIFGTERQEALDKLSAKLRGYGTAERAVRTLALPMLPEDPGKAKDSVMLGRILKALEKNSSTARKDLSTAYADRVKNARIEGKGKLGKRLLAEGARRIEGMEKTYDEANNLLDAMFEKYKVPYEKEDNLFLEAYGQLYYGTEPKEPTSIGGTTIGGAPIGPGTASGKTSIGGAPARHGPGRVRSSQARQTRVTTIGGVPVR